MSLLALVLPIAEKLIADAVGSASGPVIAQVQADVLLVARTVAGKLVSEVESLLLEYVEERLKPYLPVAASVVTPAPAQ